MELTHNAADSVIHHRFRNHVCINAYTHLDNEQNVWPLMFNIEEE